MARIFSNVRFDQVNFSFLSFGTAETTFFDDAFLTFNDIAYEDTYAFNWLQSGSGYSSVIAGEGIIDYSFLITGAVQGYFEIDYRGAQPQPLFWMEDLYEPFGYFRDLIIGSSQANIDFLLRNLLSGPDTFTLSLFDDVAFGMNGNDFLIGRYGDDLLNGGSGIDTSAYSGTQDSYTLTLSPISQTVEDRRTNGNGTDTLIDVEFLDFDTDLTGAPFDLRQFSGSTGLTAQDFENFIELYIAYFNRAPDALGLNFWGTVFSNGLSLDEIAAEFAPQPETMATYPEGTSNTEFASAVYDNVLGRVPDQAGLEFWVSALDSGDVSRDQFILAILRGVEDGSADRTYLDNKVDVGAYFAVHKGMSDVANAQAVMARYDGTASSIDAAVSAIDDFYQVALDPVDGEFLLQVVGVLENTFEG